jgi:membrane protein involved in colicin uptake
MDNVAIVYTPWANLKKTGDMDVGQVGFHHSKQVKRVYVETRVNEVVNRLNKTKEERHPDLEKEKLAHEKQLRAKERIETQKRKKEQDEQKAQWQKDKEERDYRHLFDQNEMTTNKRWDSFDNVEDAEQDFM